jgi:hypothetical protein
MVCAGLRAVLCVRALVVVESDGGDGGVVVVVWDAKKLDGRNLMGGREREFIRTHTHARAHTTCKCAYKLEDVSIRGFRSADGPFTCTAIGAQA